MKHKGEVLRLALDADGMPVQIGVDDEWMALEFVPKNRPHMRLQIRFAEDSEGIEVTKINDVGSDQLRVWPCGASQVTIR